LTMLSWLEEDQEFQNFSPLFRKSYKIKHKKLAHILMVMKLQL
jgi:hypothetical protein